LGTLITCSFAQKSLGQLGWVGLIRFRLRFDLIYPSRTSSLNFLWYPTSHPGELFPGFWSCLFISRVGSEKISRNNEGVRLPSSCRPRVLFFLFFFFFFFATYHNEKRTKNKSSLDSLSALLLFETETIRDLRRRGGKERKTEMETPPLTGWLKQKLFHDFPSILSENHVLIWVLLVVVLLLWTYGIPLYHSLLHRLETRTPLTPMEEKQLQELEESRRVVRLKQQEEHRERVRLAEERRLAKEEEKRLQRIQELEASLSISPSSSTKGQKLGDGVRCPSPLRSSSLLFSSLLLPFL
jgi:hypothetical protein